MELQYNGGYSVSDGMQLERFDALEAKLGFKLLCPELRIILTLLAKGTATSTELMVASKCSQAGFHITRRRMLDQNVIGFESCPTDYRSKIYSLSPEAGELLNETLRAFFLEQNGRHAGFSPTHHAEAVPG